MSISMVHCSMSSFRVKLLYFSDEILALSPYSIPLSSSFKPHYVIVIEMGAGLITNSFVLT